MKVRFHELFLAWSACFAVTLCFTCSNAWSITCNELVPQTVKVGEFIDDNGKIHPYIRVGDLPSDYFVLKIIAYVSYSNKTQNTGLLSPEEVAEMEPLWGKNSYIVKEGKTPTESRFFSFQVNFQDVQGNEIKCNIPPSPGAQSLKEVKEGKPTQPPNKADVAPNDNSSITYP